MSSFLFSARAVDGRSFSASEVSDEEHTSFLAEGDSMYFVRRATRVTDSLTSGDAATNCYDVNGDAFYAASIGSRRDGEYLARIGFPPKSVLDDRPSVSHRWHIGNPTLAKDLVDTLHGDIDRKVIATRSLDSQGRLVLTPSMP